ncbi:hypothetical protein HPB50_028535 [Hyalomma asiaticum]|nr:hypothetical protein HPB50_028535 [Hyalomma asiaticum]
MTSKCLVEFRDKKIVVRFDEALTQQELFSNLEASGALTVDTAQLRLTVYDDDFSTFVDVTDDFIIKDKFKLLLKEVSEYRVVDVLDTALEPVTTRVLSAPMLYTLPSVPLDIRIAVEAHQQGMHFDKRRRVIQWLFHDLSAYGM